MELTLLLLASHLGTFGLGFCVLAGLVIVATARRNEWKEGYREGWEARKAYVAAQAEASGEVGSHRLGQRYRSQSEGGDEWTMN